MQDEKQRIVLPVDMSSMLISSFVQDARKSSESHVQDVKKVSENDGKCVRTVEVSKKRRNIKKIKKRRRINPSSFFSDNVCSII